MWFTSLPAHPTSARKRPGRRVRPNSHPTSRFVPLLERLEGRALPSTITVLNNHDTGQGSLREAIGLAQSGDTIDFDPGLAGQTITLTSGELGIDHSLDIEGLGARRLTVSGNDSSRVFDVTAAATVTISGLTIAHGLAVDGGAIANFGADLTLADTMLAHNHTQGDPAGDARGGGIFNDSAATLHVRDSLFTDNEARGGDGGMGGVGWGGGLYNEGDADVTDSTFRDNVALGGQGSIGGDGIGGGIVNRNNGVLSLSDSMFSQNRAVGAVRNGGGVSGGLQNDSAVATVSHCVFTHNVARGGTGVVGVAGGAATAGAISTGSVLFGAALTVTHSTMVDNQALGAHGGQGADGGLAAGGAVANTALSDFPTLFTLDHDTIADNQALGGDGTDGGNGGVARGGGIRNSGASAALVVMHCTINDNEARGGMGGIGGDGQGGGFFIISGQASLDHSVITHNQAVGGAGTDAGSDGQGVGGGVYIGAAADVSISHSRIRHNRASTSDDDLFQG